LHFSNYTNHFSARITVGNHIAKSPFYSHSFSIDKNYFPLILKSSIKGLVLSPIE
jgi:hypothetical protein